MSRPPSIREIAELTARLRQLATAGIHADVAEQSAFLADTDALLDRITAAAPNPATDARAGGSAEPVSVAIPLQWLGDADRRRTEPKRPDSPEELAARLAELRGRVSGAAAAAFDSAEQQRRAQLALWHTHDHGADDHAAVRGDDGDAVGWSR